MLTYRHMYHIISMTFDPKSFQLVLIFYKLYMWLSKIYQVLNISHNTAKNGK